MRIEFRSRVEPEQAVPDCLMLRLTPLPPSFLLISTDKNDMLLDGEADGQSLLLLFLARDAGVCISW